jgi:Tetratricopeptide repeat
MELSIVCYELALEIYNKEDCPIDWAMTQNNLAGSYSNRITGDKAENMEKSIAGYRSALEIYTVESLALIPREFLGACWSSLTVGTTIPFGSQLDVYRYFK